MTSAKDNQKDVWPKLVPELYVKDIKQSLEFYTRLLGFHVKYDRPEEGFAYLDNGGAHIMLEQYDLSSRTWWTANFEHPLGRGINFQIEVDDVGRLYLNIQNAGHPIFLPVEDKWYRTGNIEGGNRQFIVQDPDGYLLRLFTSLGERPIG